MSGSPPVRDCASAASLADGRALRRQPGHTRDDAADHVVMRATEAEAWPRLRKGPVPAGPVYAGGQMPGEPEGPPRHPVTPVNWGRPARLSPPPGPGPASTTKRRTPTVVVQFWSAYSVLFVAGVLIQASFQTGTYDGAVSFIPAPVLLAVSVVVPALTLVTVAVPGLAVRLVPVWSVAGGYHMLKSGPPEWCWDWALLVLPT